MPFLRGANEVKIFLIVFDNDQKDLELLGVSMNLFGISSSYMFFAYNLKWNKDCVLQLINFFSFNYNLAEYRDGFIISQIKLTLNVCFFSK